MLIIEVKEGETIERALKRYKRKHRNVQITKQLREKRYYTKPSVRRRDEILNAQYKLKYLEQNKN